MEDWKELLLISAALKTNLLQSIAEEEKTAEELADNFGYDLRAVELVLEALYELNLAKKVRGHYKATKAASIYVDPNDPLYKANSLLHNARLIGNWVNLDQAIMTGKSQSRRRSDGELEIFARSMDEHSRATANEVAAILAKTKPDAKTALDAGGALGTYSKAMLANGLSVTLLDTEAITNLTKKHLKGLPINIVAGDFTKELPRGPFDIILLANITHIYRPNKLEALFSSAVDSLTSDGIIAIVDFVREKSKSAAMFGVNMLVHTAGGGTWTQAQYERWLRHAGLRLNEIKDLVNADQKILIARKLS